MCSINNIKSDQRQGYGCGGDGGNLAAIKDGK